jgi:hypothetical protein
MLRVAVTTITREIERGPFDATGVSMLVNLEMAATL